MQLKRIISFFLAVILACTVLPVKQVGSLLAGNQMQEEIPHSIDGKISFGKETGKTDLFYNDIADLLNASLLSSTVFFPISVSLPDHFVGEIQTPPPNCA